MPSGSGGAVPMPWRTVPFDSGSDDVTQSGRHDSAVAPHGRRRALATAGDRIS
jgi:hypothetical protein